MICLCISQVAFVNHFMAQLFLPSGLQLLCKRLVVTSHFLEESCLYVLCIIGTWDFYAECCSEWLADGIPYVCCSLPYASELGLLRAVPEPGILQLIFVVLSEFPLPNHHLVKESFVSLYNLWDLLLLQQCWHCHLPPSCICVNESLYPLFWSFWCSLMSQEHSFISSSFDVSWVYFLSDQVLEDVPISWPGCLLLVSVTQLPPFYLSKIWQHFWKLLFSLLLNPTSLMLCLCMPEAWFAFALSLRKADMKILCDAMSAYNIEGIGFLIIFLLSSLISTCVLAILILSLVSY